MTERAFPPIPAGLIAPPKASHFWSIVGTRRGVGSAALPRRRIQARMPSVRLGVLLVDRDDLVLLDDSAGVLGPDL